MEKIMEAQGIIASCMSRIQASRLKVEVKEEKKSKYNKILYNKVNFLKKKDGSLVVVNLAIKSI